jgi:hypothetical protein
MAGMWDNAKTETVTVVSTGQTQQRSFTKREDNSQVVYYDQSIVFTFQGGEEQLNGTFRYGQGKAGLESGETTQLLCTLNNYQDWVLKRPSVGNGGFSGGGGSAPSYTPRGGRQADPVMGEEIARRFLVESFECFSEHGLDAETCRAFSQSMLKYVCDGKVERDNIPF